MSQRLLLSFSSPGNRLRSQLCSHLYPLLLPHANLNILETYLRILRLVQWSKYFISDKQCFFSLLFCLVIQDYIASAWDHLWVKSQMFLKGLALCGLSLAVNINISCPQWTQPEQRMLPWGNCHWKQIQKYSQRGITVARLCDLSINQFMRGCVTKSAPIVLSQTLTPDLPFKAGPFFSKSYISYLWDFLNYE